VIPFTKLHGNGNDFVVIDEYEGTIIPDEMKAKFASLYCERRYGIGADGVLYLSKSGTCDLKMRIFQPDESEAEMCGNGIRCLAKYAYDMGYVSETCTIETLAGRIEVSMKYPEDEDNFTATINMPTPGFLRPEIPATGEGEYVEEILEYTVYAVNTGVPHAVVFVDEIGSVRIDKAGPVIRNHHTFPQGANVNFVEQAGEDHLRIRTFERGIEGETLSCGTGATASAAVAHHLDLVGSTVHVETSGGPLTIYLGEVTKMEGPAITVYSGVIPF